MAFGLWSQKKKTTAKVQRMFSIDSQKKNFKLENAMPIKVQEVHRTPDYFESMHFFKLLLQTQGYGRVLKVLFGHFWTQKSSYADGLISKVTVFKDEALGK